MTAPATRSTPRRGAPACRRRAVARPGGGLAPSGGRRRGSASVARRRPRRPRRARPPGTYPFTGAHQAGIVTPAQDRLYTAAFDLTTTSRDELVDAAPALDHDGRAAHAGLSARAVRAGDRAVRRAAGRHRRGAGPAAGRAHDHDRVRAVAVRRASRRGRPATGSASRDRLPDGARRAPPLPGRRPRPRAQRRRPRRPGLRRRPAGRGARRPQPDPGRVRDGARSAGRSSASGARRRRRPRR